MIFSFHSLKNEEFVSYHCCIFVYRGEMTSNREFAAILFPVSLIRLTIARNTIRIHNWKVDLNF